MKTTNTILTAIIVLILVSFVALRIFIVRIDLGEVGVRTVEYAVFGDKGVEQRDFGPGWHRRIPFVETWQVFDATVQTLEFASAEDWAQSTYNLFLRRKGEDAQSRRAGERVELKSFDGYSVQMDVTIKYRIMPEKAHRVYQDAGTEARYKQLVRTESDDTMRTVFGEMRTEEFYDPDVRRTRTDQALELLRRKLEPRYVELVGILIRDITFDPAYERKILDKKLADQEVELNKSRALAEEKRGETNKIEAETEAKVLVINQEKEAELLTMQADTDKQVAEIRAKAEVTVAEARADADLYAAEKIAEATLLEKQAEAEGERLKAQALAGQGGANLVALEAARELKLNEATISTQQIDLLDVNAMVERLGAGAE